MDSFAPYAKKIWWLISLLKKILSTKASDYD